MSNRAALRRLREVDARVTERGQPLLLLVMRLVFGYGLIRTGWGKLMHLGGVTHFFAGLGIPAPAIMAPFVAGMELVGGALLVVGLLTRPAAAVLAVNLTVALLTADLAKLTGIFGDPGSFIGAAPVPFLFAALVIALFGAGRFSIDAVAFGRAPDR